MSEHSAGNFVDSQQEQLETEKFWDKIARKYAASKISDESEYQNGLKVIKSFLKPNDKVLEIGCGTGSTALELASHVAELTATDISSEMIAICKEKHKASGATNIHFQVGSTIDNALPAQSFDVVLALNLLHLVNLDTTLEQVSRLLKPDGLFISKTVCMNESFWFRALHGPLFVAKKLGMAPPTITFFNVATLDQQILAAGFEEVHAYSAQGMPIRRFLVARKLATSSH